MWRAGPIEIGPALFMRYHQFPQKCEYSVIQVTLDEADRLDWALKQFKRKVQKAGVLKDLRKKRHYEKPSVVRQRKAAAAKRRARGLG